MLKHKILSAPTLALGALLMLGSLLAFLPDQKLRAEDVDWGLCDPVELYPGVGNLSRTQYRYENGEGHIVAYYAYFPSIYQMDCFTGEWIN